MHGATIEHLNYYLDTVVSGRCVMTFWRDTQLPSSTQTVKCRLKIYMSVLD